MCNPAILEMKVRQVATDRSLFGDRDRENKLIKLLNRAWFEHESFGMICVDTEIALNNMGVDPEIVKEEASRHGKRQ